MKLYSEAIKKFKELYAEVGRSNVKEPTAMALATADAKGNPSIRMVLLKSVDEKGFTFFTNFKSRKARQIAENPRAALCFYWEAIGYQVTIEGRVVKGTPAEANAYWKTRPRESQIGAWASAQSSVLESHKHLLAQVVRYVREFRDKDVPRPAHWSGFRVIPDRIEFWQRGKFRLHQREVFAKKGGRWVKNLLYP